MLGDRRDVDRRQVLFLRVSGRRLNEDIERVNCEFDTGQQAQRARDTIGRQSWEADGFDNDDLECFYGLISQVRLSCYQLKMKCKEYKACCKSMFGRRHTQREEEALGGIQHQASGVIHATQGIFDQIDNICKARSVDVSPEKLKDPTFQCDRPGDLMVISAKVAASQNWDEAVQQYICTQCAVLQNL